MFKRVLLIFLLFIAYPCFAKTKIEVIKVYDGDSLLASINSNVFRIRLIDIDCFEGSKNNRAKIQSKRYNLPINEINKRGNLAGDFLRNELKNKEVYFDFQGIDKYNRALGYLYINNENINTKMLKTGFCHLYIIK